MGIMGIIFILIGGGLFYGYLNARRKLEAISRVETSRVADLQKMCREVAKEIGGGSFEQIVELKGVIDCDEPLESEITKKPCVYYTMSVTREWEETYSEYNPQTQRQERKMRKGSDTMSKNTQTVPFWVRDRTGQILVNPAGAEIEGIQIIDQFQPEDPRRRQQTITIGGFSFQLDTRNITDSRQTLGYRFREVILPLERNVYVLGAASDSSGELTVQKPRQKGQKFIISLKSEEELLASSQATMKWFKIGAVACGVLGFILLIASLVV